MEKRASTKCNQERYASVTVPKRCTSSLWGVPSKVSFFSIFFKLHDVNLQCWLLLQAHSNTAVDVCMYPPSHNPATSWPQRCFSLDPPTCSYAFEKCCQGNRVVSATSRNFSVVCAKTAERCDTSQLKSNMARHLSNTHVGVSLQWVVDEHTCSRCQTIQVKSYSCQDHSQVSEVRVATLRSSAFLHQQMFMMQPRFFSFSIP